MLQNTVLVVIVFFNAFYYICLNVSASDVNTTSGLVRGSTIQALNQSIDIFLGIPFAEPPIGEKRFRKPVPLDKPIQGIANNKAPVACIQYVDPNAIFPNFPNINQSEDCLILNIYTPHVKQPNHLKPVMFWIPGGGLLVGSGFANNGTFLATNDVVVVTANYRLGPFGFLYGGSDSSPGNQGLYDQRLALLWVKQNIQLFGGDPNQITIFGESAGSWSVSAHILSPLSQGLFSRSILESGAHLHNKQKDILNTTQALAQAIQAAAQVGCNNPNTFVDCLRKLNASVINALQLSINLLEGTEYLPISAQKAFTTNQYNRDVDILAGVMRDEGAGISIPILASFGLQITDQFNVNDFINFINVLKEKYIFGLDAKRIVDFYLTNVNTSSSTSLQKAFFDFFGDVYFICPTYLFSKLFNMNNPNMKTYFFEWTYAHLDLIPGCNPLSMGICHESELAYVFGTPFTESAALQIDIDFSVETMKMWTNFAKFGNPISNTTRVQNWPKLLSNENDIKVKELNAFNFDRIFENPYNRTCDGFWNNFFL